MDKKYEVSWTEKVRIVVEDTEEAKETATQEVGLEISRNAGHDLITYAQHHYIDLDDDAVVKEIGVKS